MILAFALDKPRGLSSNQALSQIKKKFKIKKMGHTGTLDPFATGVLPVFFDEATKLIPYLDDSTKTYLATLKLGSRTDTLDETGEMLEVKEVPILSEDLVLKVFQTFLGKRMQIPPQYSAVKVNGKAMYKYARAGKTVNLEPKHIQVFSLQLISFDQNSICFVAQVSRGTYVRVLGEEIAVALHTLGHLSELRRTQSGSFNIERSVSLNFLLELESLNELEKNFRVKDLFPDMPIYELQNEVELDKLLKGQKIGINVSDQHSPEMIHQKDNKIFIYHQENLKAVGEYHEWEGKIEIQPLRIFNVLKTA